MIKVGKQRHTARMQEKKWRTTKKEKQEEEQQKQLNIAILTVPYELRKTIKHKAWAPLQIVHATSLPCFG